ncbi:MAG: type I restriction endonuclease, partial [Planctomycetota bacterium]
MSNVGQKERITQNRVVMLFKDQLKYEYLGNWEYREENSNIEEIFLCSHLNKQGYSETLIRKALFELNKVAGNQNKSLYDINKEIYGLLRYGVKVKEEVGENTQTVWLIDWKNPLNNHFAISEEVTVKGENNKRPDIVLYINGIALGVLELKRSTISVSEGIRQNLDNQKKIFIQSFFTTMQFVIAGNDTEGLRYGTIETSEKYYLAWKEDSTIANLLDRHLTQLCEKNRFLELIHNFVVFDAGRKKLCRHNQYFAVKAAQENVKRKKGGIIWHTQGSGKNLIMVWLAKWMREHIQESRVLIITDRTELDDQIENVFKGVYEDIYRTKSGKDLIEKLNSTTPWLICSLIHKFTNKKEKKLFSCKLTENYRKNLYGGWFPKFSKEDREIIEIKLKITLPLNLEVAEIQYGIWEFETSGKGFSLRLEKDELTIYDENDYENFIEDIKKNLPQNFKAKGNIYVFVDECHRTQSGELHKAMKQILPNALFIGFTGTPLLKKDKQKSIEVFGTYIHTYKFNEAVKDKVVLDLRYEARDIDQIIKSHDKIDQWFDAKTKGLNDYALNQLKTKWGTLKKVLSSRSRLEKIVADILLDMATKDRLQSGRGNALLVSGSIYQACQFYELFIKAGFDKCAIVTSYIPTTSTIKGEETGEGLTEKLKQYDLYKKMLGNKNVEEF